MTEFKIGDRVRVLTREEYIERKDDYYHDDLAIVMGLEGTIIDINTDIIKNSHSVIIRQKSIVSIIFDNFSDGHNCLVLDKKDKSGWYVNSKYLVLLDSVAPQNEKDPYEGYVKTEEGFWTNPTNWEKGNCFF